MSRRATSSAPEDVVVRMALALRHRGPDDSGVWADPTAGLAFAHRRLSIIDLSPTGRQPMISACGRYVTVLNGELYNFRQLRAELESIANGSGPRFRGHSDTEVMLAAVSHWGVEGALERFNGMFAFALWDRVSRRLFLARDRLGEKPLYYGWVGDAFIFGSELKALSAYPGFAADIDRDALCLYLRHNYVPTPLSIYKGIRKLPPGTTLTVDGLTPGVLPDPVPYWSARRAVERGLSNPFDGSDVEAIDALDELVREAVKLRMEADVPLGAFLSGGIDSSTVVGVMQAQSARPVRTFSIGFQEQRYDEATHAGAVARHLGTDHTELYLTPEQAIAVIPRLPALYDEPFGDSSQIPTFLVSELARRHVTVSLSGDGGDELFGGYERYLGSRAIWRTIGWMPPAVSGAAVKALTSLSPAVWDSVYQTVEAVLPARARHEHAGDKVHKLAEVLRTNTREALYLQMVSHWKNPASVVRGGREPETVLTDRSRWAEVREFCDWMMYIDAVTYLPDDILVKVDRASMGVGLEARVPLLDHRLFEFAWRLPLSMKVRGGQGKWPLRQVLHRYVPEAIVDRPKMGFGVPIGAWLRGPLRDWAESLLDERRLAGEGYLDPAPVRRKWCEHVAGTRNWQYYLWDVLMFEAWLEVHRS